MYETTIGNVNYIICNGDSANDYYKSEKKIN